MRRAIVMVALVLVFVLGTSCSKKDNSPRGLCERGCTKLLGCIPNAADQQDTCVSTCIAGARPMSQAQIETLEATSCEDLARGGMPGLAGPGPGAPAPAPAARRCAADCTGCVGDDSSCYMAAGGANGIPCDACCCAPGGPAPTWRTGE